jgi:hypothetical protein
VSSTLQWKPNVAEGYDLPDQLKFILRDEYELPTTLTSSDLGFLRGLIACKIVGAKELYSAIEQYESIKVFESR